MTLAACMQHQPIHRFGQGYSCALCGVPLTRSTPNLSVWVEARPAAPAPAPETTTVDTIVEAVRADLLRRSQLGIAKYGVTLDRTDLKLRDWLQHAYEETLDQANYLKRAIVELERRADGGANIVMTHTNIAGGR